jgi:hypothetical protein
MELVSCAPGVGLSAGQGQRSGKRSIEAADPTTGNRGTQKKRGRSVYERPKSREETPKEGSEASDAIANLASPNLLCGAQYARLFFCIAELTSPHRSGVLTYSEGLLHVHGERLGGRTKKGRPVYERPKSREETPKVGSDTAVPLPRIWAYSGTCAMAGQLRPFGFAQPVTRRTRMNAK